MPEPDPEELSPEIITDREASKGTKQRKTARKSAPQDPEALKDLFAPGFKGNPKPPRPAKPSSPVTTTGKPTSPPSKQPPPVRKPVPPTSASDDATTKEKQRWRSANKQSASQKRIAEQKPTAIPKPPATKEPPPSIKPPAVKESQSTYKKHATESPQSKAAASKPAKAPRPETPSPTKGSKTKRHAMDATVELEDRPEEAKQNSAAASKPDVVETSVVESAATPPPKPNKASPPVHVDQKPATPPVEKAGQNVAVASAMGTQDDEPATNVEIDDDTNRPEPIDHLLPPRFDVLDPSQMRVKAGKAEFKVLLPDGKGGMAQVDQRIIRVEHDGERVSLVAMTPEQKSRRRFIQNIIAIIIGIAIMWLAFTVLT
jgi:hypothetical protein